MVHRGAVAASHGKVARRAFVVDVLFCCDPSQMRDFRVFRTLALPFPLTNNAGTSAHVPNPAGIAAHPSYVSRRPRVP